MDLRIKSKRDEILVRISLFKSTVGVRAALESLDRKFWALITRCGLRSMDLDDKIVFRNRVLVENVYALGMINNQTVPKEKLVLYYCSSHGL